MIRINLLPSRYKSKTKGAKEFVILYVASVVVVLGLMGYLWISQRNELKTLNIRLAELEKEVKDYANYETTLQELKKKQQVIAAKTQVVEDLRKDRDKMVRLLAVFASLVPPDLVWFERFNESGEVITINGIAKSNDAIVEFMRNLESSLYIAKGTLNLDHSRQSAQANMKLRQFQLSCRFVPFSDVQQQLKAQTSPPPSPPAATPSKVN